MDRYERVDKALSNSGYGTRNEVKKMLRAGRVEVDGVCIKDGAIKVRPEQSEIRVDGESVIYKKYIYLMLNKPKGYITATKDGRERTVADLVPEEFKHYNPFPVGRLDIDTEGLLFLTNDGELTHNLISPKKNIEKVYFAQLDKPVNAKISEAFNKGVALDDGYVCKPAKLRTISNSDRKTDVCVDANENAGADAGADAGANANANANSVAGVGNNVGVDVDENAGAIAGAYASADAGANANADVGSQVEITITEGKYHQIKRMFKVFGINVVYLKRTEMAGLKLDGKLGAGCVRELYREEVETLPVVSRA